MREPSARSALRGWFARHLDSAAASFARLWRKPGAALLTISVMALALSLPLGLWLALANLSHLPPAMERSRTIELFLIPEIDAERATALATQLRGLDGVALVEQQSPEQGLAELRAQGLDGVDELLGGDNPLPHLLRVTPLGEDAALIARLAELPEVELLQHDRQWHQQVAGWLHFGNRLVWVLGVLSGLGAVLVVGNTVRLDIHSRREEMRVLQLLGAGSHFIGQPFVYLGVWYGLLGAALALVLIAAALAGLRVPLEALVGEGEDLWRLRGFSGWNMLLIVIGGTALGGLGAKLVSGYLLRRSEVENE